MTEQSTGGVAPEPDATPAAPVPPVPTPPAPPTDVTTPPPASPTDMTPPPPAPADVTPPPPAPAPMAPAAPGVAYAANGQPIPVFANGKPMVDAFGEPVSDKSRLAAALLCWFLGVLGVHRFYVGKIGTGILMLVTLGALGIWVLIDFIVILVGSFRDKEGKKLVNW